jgi:hypothetical protein
MIPESVITFLELLIAGCDLKDKRKNRKEVEKRIKLLVKKLRND